MRVMSTARVFFPLASTTTRVLTSARMPSLDRQGTSSFSQISPLRSMSVDIADPVSFAGCTVRSGQAFAIALRSCTSRRPRLSTSALPLAGRKATVSAEASAAHSAATRPRATHGSGRAGRGDAARSTSSW
jgi:hypothetical protein